MAYYGNILEEELKNKVAHDLFDAFDTTQIIGRIDFCVSIPADPLGLNEAESLLWAEAKKGTSHDIYESFIQLILTLGKERPQDTILPPAFLGAFDAEKIAFLPYSAILEVLRQNDFNWNVAPSDHTTKEFLGLKGLLTDTLHNGLEIYNYEKDSKELFYFIRRNFTLRKQGVRHIRINKNNFTHIYLKWLEAVKPTIAIDWNIAKKEGIIDADFYLADILSKDGITLQDKLFVLLKDDRYIYNMQRKATGAIAFETVDFNDKQVAHTQFWNRYARPPRREYWDEIVNRRDLLVPQDVRERKGSFFTPARWVELSQQYIAAELGENWQEEYYVWDCCAGTGNLLAGLQNKYNIYASTLDEADVSTMKQRIQNGANLLENHVFQFDFLNDPLLDEVDKNGNVTKKSKLPDTLQDIIRDSEKRRKLVVYINPPYAEADNRKGQGRRGVAKSYIHKKYDTMMGYAKRELFVQFFARIYNELPLCTIAAFSTLTMLQGSKFSKMRNNFKVRLARSFIVPANTFDNVKGEFPIAFQVMRCDGDEPFKDTGFDVYGSKGEYWGIKHIFAYNKEKYINDWTLDFIEDDDMSINDISLGTIIGIANDFQNQSTVRIENPYKPWNHQYQWQITKNNLIHSCVYLCCRRCIKHSWLNHNDQFLYPNPEWKKDEEFISDSLVYTLFNEKNYIKQLKDNHWIPFTEEEVGAQEKFESHFMSNFIHGRIKREERTEEEQKEFERNGKNYHEADAFADPVTISLKIGTTPLSLSPEALAVMDAGRELWRYYHSQPIAKEWPNASYYDIRLYFQGTKTTKSGKQQMNTESADATYTSLITDLRQKQKELAKKIEPKVYEYGFLKK